MNPLKTISKSDTELRVGNYMILFGGRDLAGEFFTKNTRFDSNYTDLGMLYEDFEHGMDPEDTGNDHNQRSWNNNCTHRRHAGYSYKCRCNNSCGFDS